jgi:exodeoxyribonuclease V gamma subunit
MVTKRTILLSNQLEKLAANLYIKMQENAKPFSKCYVLTTNARMKKWLQLFFVNTLKSDAVMGIDFINISSISSFFGGLTTSFVSFPTMLELRLAVEEKIRDIINSYSELDVTEKSIFLPLHQYFEEDYWNSKSLTRLYNLSEELAQLFFQYGIDGDISKISKAPYWQERIWQSIFIEDKWSYPAKALQSDININIGLMQIHSFGINYMSPLYNNFLDRLSEYYHVYDYILSPSSVFWEDIATDYEAKNIIKYCNDEGVNVQEKEELEQYLSYKNPILANFGKVGREYSKLISSDNTVYEMYDDVEDKPLSLLGSLQRDLLIMRNSELEDKMQVIADNSFEVHVSESKKREVEELYQYLQNLLHSDDDITLSDITVFAPSITEYVPFIHMVFGEGKLHYSISDIDASKNSHFIQGVLQLLILASSKWEKDDVMSLLTNPSFMKKQGLKEDAIFQIEKWVNNSNISWGRDASHRKDIIDNISDDDMLYHGTWDDAITTIINNFAAIEETLIIRGNSLDITQIEIFDKFLKILRHLQADILLLHSHHRLTLREGMGLLQKLSEEYFLVDDDSFEEKAALLFYKSFLQKLQKAIDVFDNKTFSSHTLLDLLQRHLQKRFASYSSTNINTIQFASIKQGVIPSKVICVMGMQEDFPGYIFNNTLDLMKRYKQKVFSPNTIDIARYFFIEVILSSRKYLYFSYYKSALEKKEGSSPLLEEILSYINKYYQYDSGHSIVKQHFTMSFDKKYFSTKEKASFSHENYLASKSYYQAKKRKDGPVIFSPLVINEADENKDTIIDIKDLQQCASNPLKFYFNKVMGVYLEQNIKDKAKQQKEMTLSPLDRYFFRSAAIKGREEEVYDYYKSQGKFSGVIGTMSHKAITHEISSLTQSLQLLGIDKDKTFSIVLDEETKVMEKQENGDIFLPPLTTQKDGATIKIIGHMANVTNEGLIVNIEDRWHKYPKIWPELLVYLLLQRSGICSLQDNMLMMKSFKKKQIMEVDDAEGLLSLYISYYWASQNQVSPLVESWAEALLLGEANKMKTKASVSNKVIYDPYFSWVISNNNNIDAKEICDSWSPFLSEIFSPIIALKNEGKRHAKI